MLHSRKHSQNGMGVAIGTIAPSPDDDAFAVLP
jgi:hypothetical protein